MPWTLKAPLVLIFIWPCCKTHLDLLDFSMPNQCHCFLTIFPRNHHPMSLNTTVYCWVLSLSCVAVPGECCHSPCTSTVVDFAHGLDLSRLCDRCCPRFILKTIFSSFLLNRYVYSLGCKGCFAFNKTFPQCNLLKDLLHGQRMMHIHHRFSLHSYAKEEHYLQSHLPPEKLYLGRYFFSIYIHVLLWGCFKTVRLGTLCFKAYMYSDQAFPELILHLWFLHCSCRRIQIRR